jgi:hypothetical protein
MATRAQAGHGRRNNVDLGLGSLQSPLGPPRTWFGRRRSRRTWRRDRWHHGAPDPRSSTARDAECQALRRGLPTGEASQPALSSRAPDPGKAPTMQIPCSPKRQRPRISQRVVPSTGGAPTSGGAASTIHRSSGPGTQRGARWDLGCEGISDGISVQWWRRPLRAVTAWSHQNARGRASGPRAERPLRARWRPSAPKSGIASATAPWQESRTPLHPHPCSALHRR